MPNLIQSLLLLLLMPGLAETAFAQGAGSTGGGSAVVCRNKRGTKIKDVRLLDLYAREIGPDAVKIPRSDVDPETQFKEILGKLTPTLAQDLRKAREQIAIDWLPENFKMSKEYDLGNDPVIIEDYCTTEWVAFYGKDNRLQVITKWYNQMSKTDQAALLLHEAAYFLHRIRAGETDSHNTREFVGLTFAEPKGSTKLAEAAARIDVDQSRVIWLDRWQMGYTLKITAVNLSTEKPAWLAPRLLCYKPRTQIGYFNADYHPDLHIPDTVWPKRTELLPGETKTVNLKIEGECRYLVASSHGMDVDGNDHLREKWEVGTTDGRMLETADYGPAINNWGQRDRFYYLYVRD